MAAVNCGGVLDVPSSPAGARVMAGSASTSANLACTDATATPGRIRQLTLAETCCGNALGAWPPSIMVVTQVVRSMPFQLGLLSTRRCAAALYGGTGGTPPMSAANSGATSFACVATDSASG